MDVVGLGLSRTGTCSLTQALGLLGYRTSHYLDGVDEGEWLNRLNGGVSCASLAEMYREFDAVSDIPAACFYREFAAEFPTCRFILTIRSGDSWLKSMQRHCEEILARDPLWSESFGARLHEYVYGSRSYDAKDYVAHFHHHNTSVVKSIARDRLLVYELCDRAGWLPLCQFLGKPVPDVAFPHHDWLAQRCDHIGGSIDAETSQQSDGYL